MADTFRWRYDATEPIMVPVDSGQTIEIGDMVYLNTDDARAASQLSFTGLTSTQESFINDFLGIAMQRSASGDTAEIRVATAGVFEMALASATAEVGDLMGPDDNSGADALEDQQVIAVGDASRAIGRVAKRNGSAATSILVRIISTNQRGGAQQEQASA